MKKLIHPALGMALAALSACTSTGMGIDGVMYLPGETTAIPTFATDRPVALAEAPAAGVMPGDQPVKANAFAPRSGASTAMMAAKPASPSPASEAQPPVVAALAPAAEAKAIRLTGGSAGVDGLIAKYASLYQVPIDLVRRVVKRESNFRPTAYNNGHWGLMQIKHATARGMGYQGPAKGLLDAETNLAYAVKYLRGAYLVAGGDHDQAVRYYARGYYYDAKRRGLLDETGLGTDRRRRM